MFFKKKSAINKRAEKNSNSAIAFVDYEYWYYTYRNQYGVSPEPTFAFTDIKNRYNLKKSVFFGDFSHAEIKNEISKIRKITDNIVETQNGVEPTKELSDFIMLDHIYRAATSHDSPSIFIILTGDGHFQTCIKFLKEIEKKVIVYSVRDNTSAYLESVADEVIEIPTDKELENYTAKCVVKNFVYISNHPERDIIPTFKKTSAAVSRSFGINEEIVRKVLNGMIERGEIKQVIKSYSRGEITIIEPVWSVMKKHEIYSNS